MSTSQRAVCEACSFETASLDGMGQQPDRSVFAIRGYQILRCPRCGLMSTDVPSDFDPDQLYSEEYFQGGVSDGYFDYLGSEALLTREYQRRVNFVRQYQPSGKLIDVGCATGGFLAQASTYFSVQGTDVSAFAVAAAHHKGLQVFCGAVEDNPFVDPPYHAITLFDTIEHLSKPTKTLSYIHSILHDSGYIFITTGDAKSLLARAMGKHWRLMTPPQHLWFFDRDNIAILLERLGFRVVSIRYLHRLVPLSLIWYQLFRGRASALPSPLNKAALPVNLYDTMAVVAQKRSKERAS